MIRLIIATTVLFATSVSTNADELSEALSTVQKIGLEGAGNQDAIAAMQVLAKAKPADIPQILGAMGKDTPIANNWLRSAAEQVADRANSANVALPISSLQNLLDDKNGSTRAREVAFEWLVAKKGDEFKQQTLAGMQNDPSLDLRRQAIAQGIEEFNAKSLDGSEAVTSLRKLIRSARAVDQIEQLAKMLEERNAKVDVPRLFGFINDWHLVAPFDNVDTKGFDKVYPPERGVDLDATYAGKDGAEVKWVLHSSEDQFGMVDLKQVFGKNKGSAAYAYAEFTAVNGQAVDLRLGCINANKVWLNGKLVTANHVYHAGTAIDQYVGQGKLKKGKNEILLKICENEQEEPWAQDWQFQFRVCDELGTAVLSKERLDALTR